MIGKKIAVVGAHGSGKTTLIHLLTAELKSVHHLNVGITREGARSSPYLIAQDSVPEGEINILGRQLTEETDGIRLYELLISDRSVMDIVMYARLFFPNPTEMHKKYFEAIEAFAKIYVRSYDAIFRLTTLYDLSKTNDPLRVKDPAIQTEAHQMLEKVLVEFGVDYHNVPPENSVPFIIGVLKGKGIVP